MYVQYGDLVNRQKRQWAKARKIVSGMTSPELWDMRYRNQTEVGVVAFGQFPNHWRA